MYSYFSGSSKRLHIVVELLSTETVSQTKKEHITIERQKKDLSITTYTFMSTDGRTHILMETFNSHVDGWTDS